MKDKKTKSKYEIGDTITLNYRGCLVDYTITSFGDFSGVNHYGLLVNSGSAQVSAPELTIGRAVDLQIPFCCWMPVDLVDSGDFVKWLKLS